MMLRVMDLFPFMLQGGLLLILILLLAGCDSESTSYELQRKHKKAAVSSLVECVKAEVVDLDIRFPDSEEEQQVLAAMKRNLQEGISLGCSSDTITYKFIVLSEDNLCHGANLNYQFHSKVYESKTLSRRTMEEEATFEAAKRYCVDKLNYLTSRDLCERGLTPPQTWTQCDGDLDADDASLNEILKVDI